MWPQVVPKSDSENPRAIIICLPIGLCYCRNIIFGVKFILSDRFFATSYVQMFYMARYLQNTQKSLLVEIEFITNYSNHQILISADDGSHFSQFMKWLVNKNNIYHLQSLSTKKPQFKTDLDLHKPLSTCLCCIIMKIMKELYWNIVSFSWLNQDHQPEKKVFLLFRMLYTCFLIFQVYSPSLLLVHNNNNTLDTV